jgi:hypothetical protein
MPNGKLSSKMRYLQDRKDITDQRLIHIMETSMRRLGRGISADQPLYYTVEIAGRHHN